MEFKDARNITTGTRVWISYYDYARGGIRCTQNLEPAEYEVTVKNNGGHYFGCKLIRKNGTLDGGAQYSVRHVFLTKKESIENYKRQLMDHSRHLMSRIITATSIGALDKRLFKYGLTSLQSDFKDISERANDIYTKLFDEC